MTPADFLLDGIVIVLSCWGVYAKYVSPRVPGFRKALEARFTSFRPVSVSVSPGSAQKLSETAEQQLMAELLAPVPVPIPITEPELQETVEPELPSALEPEPGPEEEDEEWDESWEDDEEEEEEESTEPGETNTLPPSAVPPDESPVRTPTKRFAAYLPQSPEAADMDRWEQFKQSLLANVIHMIAIGSSGAGKTLMLQNLAQTLLNMGHAVVVCDPDAAMGDWEGCEVYGGGDDFEAISNVLGGLVALMKERREERARGIRKFDPYWFILDEFGEISPECEGSSKIIGRALRRARKLDIHIIIGVQDTQVQTMGFKGQSALLQNTRIVKVVLDDRGRRTLIYGSGDTNKIRIPVFDVPNTPEVTELSSSSFKPVSLEEFTGGVADPGERDSKDVQIMQMLEDGHTYAEIRAELGTSTARIARARHQLNALHSKTGSSAPPSTPIPTPTIDWGSDEDDEE